MPAIDATAQDERRFLKRVQNHQSMSAILDEFGGRDRQTLWFHAVAVARCWFRVGREHLEDARDAAGRRRIRSTYSRAYYAAYNASKALRYLAYGSVSLKGDDHRLVGKLPDAFPDVDAWAARLTELYQHRLRADYDGWSYTEREMTLRLDDVVQTAEEFMEECEQYIRHEYGVTI